MAVSSSARINRPPRTLKLGFTGAEPLAQKPQFHVLFDATTCVLAHRMQCRQCQS